MAILMEFSGNSSAFLCDNFSGNISIGCLRCFCFFYFVIGFGVVVYLSIWIKFHTLLCIYCGISSVGRASACQAEGRQFESGIPLNCLIKGIFMKINKQKRDGYTVSLTIEISPDEFEVACGVAFKRVAKSASIPGFRKGKASREVFEKHYGKAVLIKEAIGDAVDKAYSDALKEADLKVVDYPKNIKIEEYKENEPLLFSCDVDVEPDIKLGKYKGVKVEVTEQLVVSDEEVQKQVDQFHQSLAKHEVVDRVVQKDDLVTLEMKAFIGDIVVDDWTQKEIGCQLGNHQYGPDFEKEVLGKVAKEPFSFSLDYAADFEQKVVAGKTVLFELEILFVKEKNVPELTDALVKQYGSADSVDAFTTSIRDRMVTQREKDEKEQVRQAVLDGVSDQVTVAIPPGMVQQEIDYELRYYEQTLKQSKLSMDQYFKMMGKSKEAFVEEMKPNIEKRVKQQQVLTAITKQENVSIEETERLAHIEKAYPQLKTDEDRAKFLKQINVSQLDEQIAQVKTVDFLVECAKIKKVPSKK